LWTWWWVLWFCNGEYLGQFEG